MPSKKNYFMAEEQTHNQVRIDFFPYQTRECLKRELDSYIP